jgi:hypothetical protein
MDSTRHSRGRGATAFCGKWRDSEMSTKGVSDQGFSAPCAARANGSQRPHLRLRLLSSLPQRKGLVALLGTPQGFVHQIREDATMGHLESKGLGVVLGHFGERLGVRRAPTPIYLDFRFEIAEETLR